ncbi:hypothetical protein [Mesobacillus foraminis]|nr:hypothetical protein [Mesobacillus foraminis]
MGEKENRDMATATIYDTFTLNEDAIRKIISSPRTKIKESGVFNDLKVSETERLANAQRILNSRRKCK